MKCSKIRKLDKSKPFWGGHPAGQAEEDSMIEFLEIDEILRAEIDFSFPKIASIKHAMPERTFGRPQHARVYLEDVTLLSLGVLLQEKGWPCVYFQSPVEIGASGVLVKISKGRLFVRLSAWRSACCLVWRASGWCQGASTYRATRSTREVGKRRH